MSMDYPDYLRIREKSKLLGILWIVGDIGYYVGLLGAFFSLLFRDGLGPKVKAILFFLVVFLVSVALKNTAHARSGIHDTVGEGKKKE